MLFVVPGQGAATPTAANSLDAGELTYHPEPILITPVDRPEIQREYAPTALSDEFIQSAAVSTGKSRFELSQFGATSPATEKGSRAGEVTVDPASAKKVENFVTALLQSDGSPKSEAQLKEMIEKASPEEKKLMLLAIARITNGKPSENGTVDVFGQSVDLKSATPDQVSGALQKFVAVYEATADQRAVARWSSQIDEKSKELKSLSNSPENAEKRRILEGQIALLEQEIRKKDPVCQAIEKRLKEFADSPYNPTPEQQREINTLHAAEEVRVKSLTGRLPNPDDLARQAQEAKARGDTAEYKRLVAEWFKGLDPTVTKYANAMTGRREWLERNETPCNGVIFSESFVDPVTGKTWSASGGKSAYENFVASFVKDGKVDPDSEVGKLYVTHSGPQNVPVSFEEPLQMLNTIMMGTISTILTMPASLGFAATAGNASRNIVTSALVRLVGAEAASGVLVQLGIRATSGIIGALAEGAVYQAPGQAARAITGFGGPLSLQEILKEDLKAAATIGLLRGTNSVTGGIAASTESQVLQAAIRAAGIAVDVGAIAVITKRIETGKFGIPTPAELAEAGLTLAQFKVASAIAATMGLMGEGAVDLSGRISANELSEIVRSDTLRLDAATRTALWKGFNEGTLTREQVLKVIADSQSASSAPAPERTVQPTPPAPAPAAQPEPALVGAEAKDTPPRETPSSGSQAEGSKPETPTERKVERAPTEMDPAEQRREKLLERIPEAQRAEARKLLEEIGAKASPAVYERLIERWSHDPNALQEAIKYREVNLEDVRELLPPGISIPENAKEVRVKIPGSALDSNGESYLANGGYRQLEIKWKQVDQVPQSDGSVKPVERYYIARWHSKVPGSQDDSPTYRTERGVGTNLRNGETLLVDKEGNPRWIPTDQWNSLAQRYDAVRLSGGNPKEHFSPEELQILEDGHYPAIPKRFNQGPQDKK